MARRRLRVVAVGACSTEGTVPRIGYLTSGRCPSDQAGAPFAEGLRARGHVIGQTIVIECRVSDQADDQRFRAMAAELIEAKVDLIVGISSTATRRSCS
jgi:hypothetical protein